MVHTNTPTHQALCLTIPAFDVMHSLPHYRIMAKSVTDSENRAYYGVKLGPKVGLFMSDNRVERSIHR